ncbi:MAG: DUF3618 domain-containing protein [Microbacteriaceae bacterium]
MSNATGSGAVEPSLDRRIVAARAELEETLDAIEDKLNLPRHASRLAGRARAAYRRNPVPWIATATALALAVAGAVAWAVFSDD